jgi:hypothetical protein
VQLAKLPDVGVPNTGVVKLGDVIVCTPVKVLAPNPAFPLAYKYLVTIQLPDPRLLASYLSFAAVVIFAVPGRIKDVALWVRVSAPVNLPFLFIPSATLSNDVIVVVPDISTFSDIAAPIAVDVADATMTVVAATVLAYNCAMNAAWARW